jgi:hypothetical protein
MAKYEKELRQPEIESRANAWKAFMLPLHHWRCKLAILMLFHKNIASFIYTYYSIPTTVKITLKPAIPTTIHTSTS